MNRKIMKMFEIVGMEYFWGNFFDSRFYIGYLISRKNTDVILDIGCGAGILLSLSNSPWKIGLDLSINSLKSAKKLDSTMDLVCCDATNLPFKNDFFPFIVAVQILPELKKSNLEWKKAVYEIKRISKKNECEIIFAGNNRTSKYFQKYNLESRLNYLTHKEQLRLLKDDFEVSIIGYDPYPKVVMYSLKKILFKIPEKIAESFGIEKLIYRFLRSRKFLKEGRSYVIWCREKKRD